MPPRLLEALLSAFLPPSCREHVLGDLCERYRNPWQYLGQAAGVVPLVILSRVLRATEPRVLVMEACCLYISFVAAAYGIGPPEFLVERAGLLTLLIPTATGLVVISVADAWAIPGKRSPLRPVADALLGLALACGSSALIGRIQPDLAVPRWILLYGSLAAVVLVSTLRMLFPPGSGRPRGAT